MRATLREVADRLLREGVVLHYRQSTDHLTRQLAIEYASHGIRVNRICPGWIETGFNDPVLGHLGPDELDQLIRQQVPLGRPGTPEDVAPSVVFLASDWARYITGLALVIDGGLVAGALGFRQSERDLARRLRRCNLR